MTKKHRPGAVKAGTRAKGERTATKPGFKHEHQPANAGFRRMMRGRRMSKFGAKYFNATREWNRLYEPRRTTGAMKRATRRQMHLSRLQAEQSLKAKGS